jgi:glycosyltransferase involved in cell wall biosynthesis
MAVYNGADQLHATLESILAQRDCSVEFIVVNDGSSDTSGALLDERAADDSRLRVFHQSNSGLTRALVRGCAEARGEFVARMDVGDRSLPGRFAAQVEILQQHADVSFVSCWTEVVGPRGEVLRVVRRPQVDCTDSVRGLGALADGPSHHGSVMFRRAAYLASGGYRPAFYFAQDIDLWLRLVDRGRFFVVPEVLYQSRVAPDTISGTWRREQEELRVLAIALALQRRAGGESSETLSQAESIRPTNKQRKVWLPWRRAQSLYFIGESLRRRGDRRAVGYFRRALSVMPLHARSWVRLAQSITKFGWRDEPD